jgi:hypothetical protein
MPITGILAVVISLVVVMLMKDIQKLEERVRKLEGAAGESNTEAGHNPGA